MHSNTIYFAPDLIHCVATSLMTDKRRSEKMERDEK